MTDNVAVIDTATNLVTKTISLGGTPKGVAFGFARLDDEGPVTSNVEADPNPVSVSLSTILTANVDDTATGRQRD